MTREPFEFLGVRVLPGTRRAFDFPVAQLYTHSALEIPLQVIHGRRPGPTLLVCAAIHGDEINGVEIIRRLLKSPSLHHLRGTLIAVPIVNVFGLIHRSRYLPDRRDLNRNFPGSLKGSLTSRAARLFMDEVVSKASHIVDLHTGAIHRENLPQIRANLDDPDTEALAHAFGIPMLINSDEREGSLRGAACAQGIPAITYEAGEALRFDETSIRAGLRGVLSVLRSLGMIRGHKRKSSRKPVVARSTSWVRADHDGILRPMAALGQRVKKGELLARISDPLGEVDLPVTSHYSGIIIGANKLPLVNVGDALFHIARFERVSAAERLLETFDEELALEQELHDQEDDG